MGKGMAQWGNAPWRPTDAAGDSPAGAGSLGAALVVVRQRDTRCVGLPRSAATDHCAGRSAPRGSNDPGTSYRLPATSSNGGAGDGVLVHVMPASASSFA